jgi:predicted nucleic acid-binding protein
MIVVDASALVEWMTDAAGRSDDVAVLLARDAHWVTTEHLLVEAMSAFRLLWLGGGLDDAQFDELARRLASYELDVWPTRPLLPRIRELAHNATTYDAAYIALAEEVGAPLVTTDAKLAAVPGIRCTILGP